MRISNHRIFCSWRLEEPRYKHLKTLNSKTNRYSLLTSRRMLNTRPAKRGSSTSSNWGHKIRLWPRKREPTQGHRGQIRAPDRTAAQNAPTWPDLADLHPIQVWGRPVGRLIWIDGAVANRVKVLGELKLARPRKLRQSILLIRCVPEVRNKKYISFNFHSYTVFLF